MLASAVRLTIRITISPLPTRAEMLVPDLGPLVLIAVHSYVILDHARHVRSSWRSRADVSDSSASLFVVEKIRRFPVARHAPKYSVVASTHANRFAMSVPVRRVIVRIISIVGAEKTTKKYPAEKATFGWIPLAAMSFRSRSRSSREKVSVVSPLAGRLTTVVITNAQNRVILLRWILVRDIVQSHLIESLPVPAENNLSPITQLLNLANSPHVQRVPIQSRPAPLYVLNPIPIASTRASQNVIRRLNAHHARFLCPTRVAVEARLEP
ncbi:hypothetical protein D9757_013341 [Collybiopsis confluens]|uniref:Uncharacterized protein n=1 Tax=Collybiopsis confluens TaxID=2823264 RepID=A0A8H5D822_9AGAR|nr:hypothetical protein D9757_013341 [Collybiopsis confluens]